MMFGMFQKMRWSPVQLHNGNSLTQNKRFKEENAQVINTRIVT